MAPVFLSPSIADTFTCISKWSLLECGWPGAAQFLGKEGSGFREKRGPRSPSQHHSALSFASEKSFLKSPSARALLDLLAQKWDREKKKKKTSRRGKAASIQPGVRGGSSSLPTALPLCQALLCLCTALPGGNRKAFSNPGCCKTGLQPQGVKMPSHARHFTATSCVSHNSAPPA